MALVLAPVLTRAPVLALSLVLASCATHHRVEVTGSALAREVEALRERGSASVSVEERRGDETIVRRETIHIDQTIGADDERHVVRDLIASCPGDRCELTPRWNLPMRVREYETRSAKPVVGGAIAVALLGGAVWAVSCGIACDEGTTAKSAANYTAIGYGVVIVGSLGYLLVSCLIGRGCLD